jgi:hypothetical protein
LPVGSISISCSSAVSARPHPAASLAVRNRTAQICFPVQFRGTHIYPTCDHDGPRTRSASFAREWASPASQRLHLGAPGNDRVPGISSHVENLDAGRICCARLASSRPLIPGITTFVRRGRPSAGPATAWSGRLARKMLLSCLGPTALAARWCGLITCLVIRSCAALCPEAWADRSVPGLRQSKRSTSAGAEAMTAPARGSRRGAPARCRPVQVDISGKSPASFWRLQDEP